MTAELFSNTIAADASLQHTLGHVDCEACRGISLAKTMESDSFGKLLFPEASALWLESRKGIEQSTRFNYSCYFKSLGKFFGELTLAQIEIGHVQTYQAHRSQGLIPGLRQAGASVVNHELNALSQVMERAGLWAKLADWYEPLANAPARIGCALAEEQEARLLRTAQGNSRWKVAYLCALITANTTAGGGEIRRLTLGDVDLGRRTIYIREGAKNTSRVRQIPLNEDAYSAVSELYARAQSMGACNPDHYMLPHRAANRKEGPDPTRPAGSWKKAWDSLRKAAGLPKLRYYDLRHHAITKLLEDPNIPERAVIDLAGHVSNQMLDTYSHTRRRTLEEAVARVNTGVAARQKPYIINSPLSQKDKPCLANENTPSLPDTSPQRQSPTSQASNQWIAFSSTTYRSG